MSKRPYKKREQKKKTVHTTHPYIEAVQEEIASLEEKLHSFEEKEARNGLTSEEETEKVFTKCGLECQQAILTKLNDNTTQSKLKSYTDSQLHNSSKDTADKKVIDVLSLFYIMRLGQCGLLDQIAHVTSPDMLTAFASLSDQLIGSAVYYKVDHNNIQKRQQAIDLVKKLERGDDEPISVGQGVTTTFKQVKDLLKHIWENVKIAEPSEMLKQQQLGKEGVVEQEGQSCIVFDGMIPASSITAAAAAAAAATTTTTTTLVVTGESNKEKENNVVDQEKVKSPVENVIKSKEAAAKLEETTEETSTNDEIVEKSKEEEEENGWGSKPVLDKNDNNTWEFNEQPAPPLKENKLEEPEHKQDDESISSWNEKQKQFDSWDNVKQPSSNKQEDADKNGWTKSFDSTTQADNWDNNNTGTSPNMSLVEEEQDESPKLQESRSMDNWRRRGSDSYEGSRGRGRGRGSNNSYRGRGSGDRGGRGRGNGSFYNQRSGGSRGASNVTGRGRGGRGRGRPDHSVIEETSSLHRETSSQ